MPNTCLVTEYWGMFPVIDETCRGHLVVDNHTLPQHQISTVAYSDNEIQGT